jgi:hypothetical protein
MIAHDDLSGATQSEAKALKAAIDTDGTDGVSQKEALAYVTNKFGSEYDFT